MFKFKDTLRHIKYNMPQIVYIGIYLIDRIYTALQY